MLQRRQECDVDVGEYAVFVLVKESWENWDSTKLVVQRVYTLKLTWYKAEKIGLVTSVENFEQQDNSVKTPQS